MQIETFDHVALWVGDRDRLADFLTSHIGMHEIQRTERFTLVGSDARRGKLTLFAAEGPRDAGKPSAVVLDGKLQTAGVRIKPERSERNQRDRGEHGDQSTLHGPSILVRPHHGPVTTLHRNHTQGERTRA